MTTVTSARDRAGRNWAQIAGPASKSLVPGLIAVGLCVLWSVHNGGFDADTWYWGALVLLATLVVTVAIGRREARPISLTLTIALGAFGAYTAWSFLSISWAAAPGVALTGANRTLLYLIVFALMSAIPWRASTVLTSLVTYSLALGAIAVVLILRLASADAVSGLFVDHRLAAPSGYYNANAAMFTMAMLTATFLGSRRELPPVVRGLLIAAGCASLQLALVSQSRGWLFTLPLILLAAIAIVPGRVRFVLFGILPAAALALNAHKLLAIFNDRAAATLNAGSRGAGREALVLTVAAFVIATVAAWIEMALPSRQRPPRVLRLTGVALVTVLVLAAGVAGAVRATNGDPIGFVTREWNGFSRPPVATVSGSHFETVGSGRYDFWRAAWSALMAHPVGGLGQDNFENYYLLHRHTGEEPVWTHSLEMRLLAHTGLVGFALFVGFLAAALTAIGRARRRGPPLTQIAVSAALLPLLPWLLHGSVDWFWELPALSGPALGFLAAGSTLTGGNGTAAASRPKPGPRRALVRSGRAVIGIAATVAATLALGFPYLAVREISQSSDVAAERPVAALQGLQRAADLDPLDAEAPTRAGLLGLSIGDDALARERFAQSIERDRGAWLPWLGLGLADSALGQPRQAEQALRHAYAINARQPPITVALARVRGRHPLTYSEAVPLFNIVQ